MTCYDEYDSIIACDPNQQTQLLLWACVALAALVLLFVALVILGLVRDWFSARYGRDREDDVTTTPVTPSSGPML